VKCWETRFRGMDAIGSPCAPLIIAGPSARLIVRLILRPQSQDLMLLLTEEATIDRPQALERLGLTPREAEVLIWIVRGKTNPETAVILSIRRRTVDKHLEHIFDKLGVETRTAAAAIAWETMRHAAT